MYLAILLSKSIIVSEVFYLYFCNPAEGDSGNYVEYINYLKKNGNKNQIAKTW